jgi:hypothetical protein
MLELDRNALCSLVASPVVGKLSFQRDLVFMRGSDNKDGKKERGSF